MQRLFIEENDKITNKIGENNGSLLKTSDWMIDDEEEDYPMGYTNTSKPDVSWFMLLS